MPERVPIVVVAGSLGSGKTTVLNHVLRHRADSRIGLLVNDFGDIAVDAMLVESISDATASMAGGCLCCVIDDGELNGQLASLTSPQLGLDVVLVETSGVADPTVAVQRIHDALGRHARLGGLVHVVDAPSIVAEDDVRARLGRASLVLVTKTDLVDSTRVEDVLREVRREAPETTVVPALWGAVPPRLLFDVRDEPDVERQLLLGEAGMDDGQRPHVHLDQVSWQSSGTVHPRRLIETLENGLRGAYRVKGILDVDLSDRRGQWVVHRVGPYVQALPGPRGSGSAIVAIGPSLDAREVHAQMAACLLEHDESLDPVETYTFWRRVPHEHR
ncbi:CobW family GTP-binding protein [Aeromicrobium sp. CTD01-1L150]|uniref:CobW family GTP-binding protein n=1 Tax=Aeromicrobium sp. CTD01-1L150 TaxID=3341830 RepID=UPI0035C109A8